MVRSITLSILQGERWQNWSGSVQGTSRQIAMPGSLNELVQRISTYARDGRHVRVVGSGHSFTPLVQTDDVLMSLDNLQGIESIDIERGVATVLGGTKLKLLGDTLFARG
ncbi:MAG: FAD-binding protein, partial [Chloroflexi bacterium]